MNNGMDNWENGVERPVELETVDCLFCGPSATIPAETIRWKSVAIPFVYCSECGLKFMRKRPTQAWLHHFYAIEFWQQKMSAGIDIESELNNPNIQQSLARRKPRAENLLSWLSLTCLRASISNDTSAFRLLAKHMKNWRIGMT